MPRSATRCPLARALGLLGLLASLLGAGAPVRAQRTEVHLYVEKSASAATRDAARSILRYLEARPPQGATQVFVRSFAGAVSSATVASYSLPLAAPPSPIEAALQAATLGAPSHATIDLLRLITDLSQEARAFPRPPLGPERIFVIVLGDFAHAPAPPAWRRDGTLPQALSALRQAVVANQNVHLIAIQTPSAGAIPAGPYREVTTALAESFLFFDDFAAGFPEIADLLSDVGTPLVLQLSPRDDRGQIGFQIANPSFSTLEPIVYRARGEGVAPVAIATQGPVRLDPGTGGAGAIDLAVLQPFVPAAGCVNVWIEADGLDPATRQVIRRGTAPQPIVLGDCAAITDGVFDLEPKRRLDPKLVRFVPFVPPPGNPETFVGLSLRGHLGAPQATLAWDLVNETGALVETIGRQRIPRDVFNSDRERRHAFDGAERELVGFGFLSLSEQRKLCLAGRDDEPARLRVTIAAGGRNLGDIVLFRTHRRPGDLIPRAPWALGALVLLLLFALGTLVAYGLRAADLGRLSHAVVVLAIGALALFLGLHDGSALGKELERLFALRVEVLSTVGFVAFFLGYLLLYLLGHFDRCPSARESLRRAVERPFKKRLARRRLRDLGAVALLALLLGVAIFAVFRLRPPIEECRFEPIAEVAP